MVSPVQKVKLLMEHKNGMQNDAFTLETNGKHPNDTIVRHHGSAIKNLDFLKVLKSC